MMFLSSLSLVLDMRGQVKRIWLVGGKGGGSDCVGWRSSSSSGAIGYDIDAGNGRRRTSTDEMSSG
jgi:hypothetical protein